MSAVPSSHSSNAPEWTVSELSGALKRTLEGEFGFVRLRAEVSGYRGPHTSGHAYFSLKDLSARIDAVIWRTTFARLRVKPTEGLEVVVTGKITTFPGKSAYQIVVDSLEPAGVGALMALLEERRKLLTAEGLFDPANRRPIPYLPRLIGVVTSPSGAVIRDILHRIAERFPAHVLVWPVRVQGEGSAAEIVRAIEGFNAAPPGGPFGKPDVLIVARGGGSLEDLWSFNEEAVVRAVAASSVPLIAAVGHETDWTLIDYAADLRAPTPTGAAEKCVPVRAELVRHADALGRRVAAAISRFLLRAGSELRSAARALPTGDSLVGGPRQRLDLGAGRLDRCMHRGLDARRLRLGQLTGRLASQSPQAKLARGSARLDGFEGRLHRAVQMGADKRRQRLASVAGRLTAALVARAALARLETRSARATLDSLGRRLRPGWHVGFSQRVARVASTNQLLASLGYRNVLARGFVLARDETGAPVRNAHRLAVGARLDLQFADGHATVVVANAEKPTLRTRAARSRSEPPGQGTLF